MVQRAMVGNTGETCRDSRVRGFNRDPDSNMGIILSGGAPSNNLMGEYMNLEVGIAIIVVVSYVSGILISRYLDREERPVNLNVMAEEIAKLEGKKEGVNIAQIKELMGVTFGVLGRYSRKEINYIINKYKVEKL
jgi:hypothetical protein